MDEQSKRPLQKIKKDDKAGRHVSAAILGVDPGLSGGLAVVEGQHLLASHDMPSWTRMVSRSRRSFYDTQSLSDIVKNLTQEYNIVCAAVERVGASPQMGVSSAFKFGKGDGIIEGVLVACGLKIIHVEPSVWKRKAGLSSDKKASIIKANELFRNNFPLKDGTAEAALIAYHVLHEVDCWS